MGKAQMGMFVSYLIVPLLCSYFQPHWAPPPWQKYIRCRNLCRIWFRAPKFYAVKYSAILRDFQPVCIFAVPSFRNAAIYLKFKTNLYSADDYPMSFPHLVHFGLYSTLRTTYEKFEIFMKWDVNKGYKKDFYPYSRRVQFAPSERRWEIKKCILPLHFHTLPRWRRLPS